MRIHLKRGRCLMALENGNKKGRDFKEKVVFDLAFFLSQLKETVVDAIGIGWIFENESLKKICDVIASLVLVYVRWWIKLAIFIGVIYLIVAVVFPHSGA